MLDFPYFVLKIIFHNILRGNMGSDNHLYQAYYTKSDDIVSYMTSLLDLNGSEKVLEPCAGDGVFIDYLIEKYPNIEVDALELKYESYVNLCAKYSNKNNISIRNTDTLTDSELYLQSSIGNGYDAVIANPPYGAWREQNDRKNLKKLYNGFYAKESYSLFLYRCIESLRENGRLSFIIPDTYLSLHRHRDIREYILTKTKIKEIALFPSSFFPGINFGYANLSIISLERKTKKDENLRNKFLIIQGYKSVSELGNNNLESLKLIEKTQIDIYNSPDHSFIINENKSIVNFLSSNVSKIEDVCDCVTGFYSGNDKEFLKVKNKKIRNSKKYDIIDNNIVEYNCDPTLIDGIKDNTKKFVPIVKGGNTKYFKPDNWFMFWTEDIINFYKTDKKARFQNSSFYFRRGIGVPMVSSSSITGALIDNRLFDQSIVGVFPKDESLLLYILAFFNSPTCNKLIKTINPSANNSSNYIKKIPFIYPTNNILEDIEINIKEILNALKNTDQYDQTLEEKNNEKIRNLYGF